MLNLRKFRRLIAAGMGAVMALMLSVSVFAASGDPIFDYSSDLTTGTAGMVAGVVAAIAVVFALALAIRLAFKGAKLGLKALGLIH